MKRVVLAAVLVVAAQVPAWATWSVIAFDQASQGAVVASAGCVAQAALLESGARDLFDLQGIIEPGVGVGSALGSADPRRRPQTVIYQELVLGRSTDAILGLLKRDAAIDTRMYAVITARGQMLAFAGKATPAERAIDQGQVTGQPIFYSVQGAGLTSADVVHGAAAAFGAAAGSIADRAMAAMEAADARGGDRDCGCAAAPRSQATTCTDKTAHTAYLVRAERSDHNSKTYNDGVYAIRLIVTDANIQPEEDANPVRTLRARYEAFLAQHPEIRRDPVAGVFPR